MLLHVGKKIPNPSSIDSEEQVLSVHHAVSSGVQPGRPPPLSFVLWPQAPETAFPASFPKVPSPKLWVEWAPLIRVPLPFYLQRQGTLLFQDSAVIHFDDKLVVTKIAKMKSQPSVQCPIRPLGAVIRHICLLFLEPLNRRWLQWICFFSLYSARSTWHPHQNLPGGFRQGRGGPFLDNGSSFHQDQFRWSLSVFIFSRELLYLW